MKTWLKVLIALAATGIVAVLLVFKFYVNKPHADIENTKAEYTLTASEIWKQYNADLKLADSLYTGKVIEVTGNLARTDKTDSLVFGVFVMEADSMFGDKSIRCEMLPKFNADASTITQGSDVKIKGFCNGFDQTDIKFSKCSIVK
jgi:primosomal replication protein N